ncbi:MFS transporter [Verticiella sediminum]
MLAGVVAALHVAKIPPAVPLLQAGLGLSLVQAGFLISLVQIAGALFGLALGLTAASLGLRRSLMLGLVVLAAASAAGSASQHPLPLLALRMVEGIGFLLIVLPAPELIRRLVPPQKLSTMLGVWGSYMPLGTVLALLFGPLVMLATGWRTWWLALAGLSVLLAVLVLRHIPRDTPSADTHAGARGWQARLADTLRSPGPWLIAASFGMYSGQWLAVVGFLPAIYAAAGVQASLAGLLTALVAAANMAGNVASGRLIARGWAPTTLLRCGFVAMAAGALYAFSSLAEAHPMSRYLALLAFSGFGGLVPGTLFILSMHVAPGEDTVSTTIGWMQQLSALGQLAGPPLVAWIAARAGGWQWTGAATATCSALGLLLSLIIARHQRRSLASAPN